MAHLSNTARHFIAGALALLLASAFAAAQPAAVQDGLAKLAMRDPQAQAEGHAIVEANIAAATDPAARAALVGALLDYASTTALETESFHGTDYPDGVDGLISGFTQLVQQALSEQGQNDARTAARRAAVRWAGWIAETADLPRLVRLLDVDAVWDEALNALMALPDEAGAHAILERLPQESSADRQMEYLRALGQYQIGAARAPLSKFAKETQNRALAFAALDALAHLGVPPMEVVPRPNDISRDEASQYTGDGLRAAQELLDHGQKKKAEGLFRQYSDSSGVWHQIQAAMVGLVAAGSEDAARTALGYLGTPHLRATAQRLLITSQIPGTAEIIDKAYKVGDAALQAALLAVYFERGGEAGHKKVQEALGGSSAEMRVTAARLLGQQPNDTDLLELAAKGAPWARKEASNSFVDAANSRLIAGDDKGAAAQFRAILQQHLGAEAERSALEGLGQCGEYSDNDFIADFLQNPETGAAAYAAKARLAIKNEDRDAAIKELETIADISPYEEGVFAAADALQKLGLPTQAYAKRRGFVGDWLALGPFPNENGSAYGVSFVTEERADAVQSATWMGQHYAWDKAAVTGWPPVVDLRTVYKDTTSGAAYLSAKFALSKPMAADIQLSLGGAFELWLNGKNTAGDPAPHAWKLDDIHIPVTLNAGVNKILIKLIQTPDDWRCAVRIADRHGKPINLENERAAKDGSEGVGVSVGRAATAVQKAAP